MKQSPLTYAFHVLATSFRLLRMRKQDARLISTSTKAAKWSFFLMLLVLPVYFFSIHTLADEDILSVPFAVLLPVLATDYVLQWVFFPVLMAGLLMMARMPLKAFPSFIIVNNSFAALSSLIAMPILALFHLGFISEDTLYILLTVFFLSMSFVLSRWASFLFKAGLGFGMVVFMLSSFSSQFISMATVEILKRYVPE